MTALTETWEMRVLIDKQAASMEQSHFRRRKVRRIGSQAICTIIIKAFRVEQRDGRAKMEIVLAGGGNGHGWDGLVVRVVRVEKILV